MLDKNKGKIYTNNSRCNLLNTFVIKSPLGLRTINCFLNHNWAFTILSTYFSYKSKI